MRIILPFLLLMSCAASGQTDSIVVFSKFEQALMEPGIFLQSSPKMVGEADQVDIGVVTAKDLNHPGNLWQIVCFKSNSVFLANDLFSGKDTHIDADELEDLIKVIQKMKATVEEKKATSLEKLSYTTSNLIVFELSNRRGNLKKYDLYIYKRYKNINAPVVGSGFVINAGFLEKLLVLLNSIQKKTAEL